MKILLTGCRGQVGWEICRRADSFDCEIVETDIHNLDIGDIDAVRSLQTNENCDVIINAAAYTAVDRAEEEEDVAYRVNATGAGNLATVAAESDVPFLHISTDYVFDGNSTCPYTDDAPREPQGVYGVTKLQGEDMVAAATSRFVTLRTSWVFGVEGNNFVKTMVRLAGERDQLTVVADQYGSPTFAGHIAHALLSLTARFRSEGSLPWGHYNFCDTGPLTWHGFATKIVQRAQATGLIEKAPEVRPILTSEFPTAAVRPMYSIMNCQLFAQTFPEIGIKSWSEGLDQVIEGMKASK